MARWLVVVLFVQTACAMLIGIPLGAVGLSVLAMTGGGAMLLFANARMDRATR